MAAKVENDEESFIILGSSPGTSLDLKCNGDAIQSESVDKNQMSDALKGLSIEAEMAFKAHFNLGECPSPASLMMASTIVSEDKSTEELQKKFGEIIDENIILKETLKQNNDSIKEQFLIIASCQEDMMKAHQLHKEKFNETRELVEKLRAENKKLKQDITKLSEAGPASLRKSIVNGETGEAVERRKSAPNSGIYEFVASPDDDTIDKLTAQLELVEKQRRQVIVENEKLSWQKESLEHIVDTTSKERDELKEKIKNLELQNSNIKTQFEDEIKVLKKNLCDAQETFESSKGFSNDEMLRKDLIIQELNSKISALQSELKTSQLKVLELENVKLEFSKQKSGVIETIKLYREQLQDLSNRLKEAQTTVFQPVRFSISSEIDSSEFSSLLNNVKLYDKTLKHLSELLNAMTEGTSTTLTKTMDLAIKLNEFKLGMDNLDSVKSGLVAIKQNVEQQHSNMLNVIGQIRGTLSIFEGIFQDFKESIKKNTSNENMEKKPLQKLNPPNVDALTAALVSRGQELEAAEKELTKLRQLATTLQKESEERDHLKAQLDVYMSDFEAEREARQKMAGERETLFTDLRTSQKRNQDLVEQLEEVRRLNANIFHMATSKKPTARATTAGPTAPSAPAHASAASPASPSATGNKEAAKRRRNWDAAPPPAHDMTREGTPPPVLYGCPVCGVKMRSIRLIQEHIDQCLSDDCAIM